MQDPDEMGGGAARARTAFERRAVLRALAATAAVPFCAAPALAATDPLTTSKLPGGLTLISGAGGNVVAAHGPDGAILVDCGEADRAEALLAQVAKSTGSAKVATLFNTCWRLTQTGGNDLLGARGAKIIAHENTKLWMGTEIVSRCEDKVYPPRAQIARPTQTFYTKDTLAAGREPIDVGYLLQAHTDSDIYVFFRKANVLVVGGAVAGRGWPMIDWSTAGWMGGMVRGLDTLIKVADADTVIVPADGPTLTRAELGKQHDMYVAIMTNLQKCLEGGMDVAQMLKAAPAGPYVAERGDPSLFLTQAFKSLWGNARQFKAV